MTAAVAQGAARVLDLQEWQDAVAVAQAQAEIEARAQTIVWTFGFVVVFIGIATVIGANLT